MDPTEQPDTLLGLVLTSEPEYGEPTRNVALGPIGQGRTVNYMRNDIQAGSANTRPTESMETSIVASPTLITGNQLAGEAEDELADGTLVLANGNGNGPLAQISDRELFRAGLIRIAAHAQDIWQNWVWSGNYENPGPSGRHLLVDALQLEERNNFVPTRMAMFGPGIQPQRTTEQAAMAQATNMSPNYRGNPENIFNYSVPNLPDFLNTSWWITRLPADVTYSELLAAITDCGRIFAVHINRGEADRIGHAGAKVVWMTNQDTWNFDAQYASNQQLIVRGQRAFIVRNRNKIPAHQWIPQHHTRCIEVTGPKEIINMPFLAYYFDPLFRYQIDQAIPIWHPNPDMATLEIRFGSYRAQADMATIILNTNAVFVDAGVRTRYVRDPCDV